MGQNNTKKKIVLLGLDYAGKTTITYKLKYKILVHTISTIGFNVEEIKYGSFTLFMWDLVGQENRRSLWSYYLSGTHGIIFVVDSADEKRLTSSSGNVKYELETILSDPKAQGVPLLVLANKQDKEEALAPEIIERRLQLAEMKDRTYKVFGCSAISENDTGVNEGIKWLTEQITLKKKEERLDFIWKKG